MYASAPRSVQHLLISIRLYRSFLLVWCSSCLDRSAFGGYFHRQCDRRSYLRGRFRQVPFQRSHDGLHQVSQLSL